MNKIDLSIDELIYCLYIEGRFDQGMALKANLLPDMQDEQFEVALQVSCRSLLSKGYISFEEAKFNLVDEVRNILKYVSVADYTYQAANALTHELLTVHSKNNEYVVHTTDFDGQVHRIEVVKLEQVINKLAEFFNVELDSTGSIAIQEDIFENMLKSFDDIELKFNLPTFNEAEKNLYKKLEETEGFLNSLLVVKYGDNNEAIAQDVLLFTASKSHNLGIVKEVNDIYTIHEDSISLIKELVK